MGSYYSEFRHFDKYARQIDSIAEAITKLDLRASKDIFNFVDVGSHDGGLTERILQILSQTTAKIQAYAFEPDKEAYSILMKRYMNTREVQLDNLDFSGWIAKYSNSLKDKVDLLLNSHTFYHFPREKWGYIISQGSKLLSQNGQHIVIIDSEHTSINKIKEELDKKVGTQRRTYEYGEFLFGDYLAGFFESRGIIYEHRTIDQPILIPSDNNAFHIFVKILGFVFRYETEDILRLAREQVMDFMVKYKTDEKYRFPRFQDMFILRK